MGMITYIFSNRSQAMFVNEPSFDEKYEGIIYNRYPNKN